MITRHRRRRRIFNFFRRLNTVFRQRLRAFPQHRSLVSGHGSAFVKLGIDLPVELPHRPAAAQGLGFVKAPGIFVFYRKKPNAGRLGK
jgi:hypothetical protein